MIMRKRRSIEKSKIVMDNILTSYLSDGYILKSITERKSKFIVQMENKKHYVIIEVYKYYAMQTTEMY